MRCVRLATDAHFATGFRHRPFPDYQVLEFMSGPLSAGIFARRDLDPTLHPERLFFHDFAPAADANGFAAAHAYFNFGEIEIERSGTLVVRIIDATGAIVFAGRYPPT